MKLLIIDDDALVCASLKTILETDPQVKVVGTGKLFLFTAVCGPMCC